jgi:methylmalonyl-CoA/ethylmalonyl-CoA epimerase
MTELRIHHLGLSVPDLESSIEWYERVLGFSLEKRVYVEPIPAQVAFLKHGSFRIELFQVEGAAPLPDQRRVPNLDLRTHGTKHLSFVVEDVAVLAQELKALGADIAMLVQVPGRRTLFVRDNAGNLIEFVQQSDFE